VSRVSAIFSTSRRQRLGVGRAPLRPPHPLRVLLRRRRLALRGRVGAHSDRPSVEAGDDPRVATDDVPLRGARRLAAGQELGEGHRGEREELQHRRARQTSAAEEQEQRARRAARAQRQRRVQPVGHAQPPEQIGEERRVGIGPRQDHAHLLEGHAVRRRSQQAAHDPADLRRLAGRGQERERGVAGGIALGRLEQPRPQPRERRRRVGHGERGEDGVGEGHGGQAPLRGPARERGPPETLGPVMGEQADGEGAGQVQDEGGLEAVQLQVVHHQHFRIAQPARLAEVLAGGAQDRGGVGEAALDRLVERSVQAGHRAQPVPVFRGRCPALGCRVHPRRLDPRPAERRQRPGQGGGHRRAGQAGGEAQAAGALVQQPRGEQGVVPGAPGQQPSAEERRLGDGPRQVHHLERVDPGHGAAGRGQPPRQLHRGSQGRHEQDDRPDPHDNRIICRAVATRRSVSARLDAGAPPPYASRFP
jgi:hypothetical protein